MSNDLHQFFIDYLQWYESGAPDSHSSFDTNVGLCSCLLLWSGHNQELQEELKDLFTIEGMERDYPFDYDLNEYFSVKDKTLNRARIAFVRKHAA